jgi:hypothetical protein
MRAFDASFWRDRRVVTGHTGFKGAWPASRPATIYRSCRLRPRSSADRTLFCC